MTDTDKTDIEKLRAELERILATGCDDSGVWWLRATIDLYERVGAIESKVERLHARHEQAIGASKHIMDEVEALMDRMTALEKRP